MGPRLRREGAEKWKPSRATKTREGGDKKELQGYTAKERRTTGCLNSSLVAYAYQRTRASRSYQQRPECLPKDQSVKKLSTKARVPTKGPERQESYQQRPECQTGTNNKNDRHDGNHTRIGRSYTMVVPMNISSHGEVGNLTVEVNKRQGRTRPLIRTTTPKMHDKH